MRDLYPTILKSLKKQNFPQSEQLLLTILSGVPKFKAKADLVAQ